MSDILFVRSCRPQSRRLHGPAVCCRAQPSGDAVSLSRGGIRDTSRTVIRRGTNATAVRYHRRRSATPGAHCPTDRVSTRHRHELRCHTSSTIACMLRTTSLSTLVSHAASAFLRALCRYLLPHCTMFYSSFHYTHSEHAVCCYSRSHTSSRFRTGCTSAHGDRSLYRSMSRLTRSPRCPRGVHQSKSGVLAGRSAYLSLLPRSILECCWLSPRCLQLLRT